ncbi:glycosyltransferase [Paenibacillus barengoltzii]|uniref:glycosyltransferase n=2 Tax=Paenibacillus barengoltzii TaxID=343517 RepID=UPI003F8A7C91
MPKLSLCMIVKNEGDCIGRCLNSVKHAVDEMIIVDTGSSDDTIDICRSAGAAVYSYEWNDDFASARNYGLERATGDWIIWLDADEEVDEADADKLREMLSGTEADLFSIQLINYYGKQADDYHVLQMAHPRMFRNRMGFRFVNPIHETLNITEVLTTPELQKRMVLAPIKVRHYGYLDEIVDAKQKGDRNLSLLFKQVSIEDKNPWLYYHIASEYYRLKQYQHSFQYVNRAIVLFLSEGMTPPSLLYKLKYSILLSLGSFHGAYPAIEKAICLYPDYVDLHFYKGLLLHFLGKTEKAIEAFDRCLELGDHQWSHLTQKGLGSFQAWYYKGLCLEQVNRQEAIHCYEQALLLHPDHQEAALALARLQTGE